MNPRESFFQCINFQAVTGRLPVFEWAKWWEPTIERWKQEGLPEHLGADEIGPFLGLDKACRVRYRGKAESYPHTEFGCGLIASREDYEKLLPHLFDPNQVECFQDRLLWMKEQQEESGLISWVGIDGFFWFPRELFGIEGHLYAFYDEPELMHQMNQDLLEYNLSLIHDTCSIYTPDFITIAEDMSYNHGPMISKEQFDEFIRPYYLKLIPAIKEYGVKVFVDSDGQVGQLIDWLIGCGVDGILPLERQSGVDIGEIRREHPDFLMMGGYDKTIMHLGEEAMRKEFERIFPVMKAGGYIPCVDHQVPPDVSLKNYLTYISLLKEYSRKAATA